MRPPRIISIVAWALLAFVAFASLSPYWLRPELTDTEPGLVVMFEHVGAFALIGSVFLVSYPERPRAVCFLIFGSAIALELGQALIPDRHARFVDALEKVVGGGAGIILGLAMLPMLAGWRRLFSKVDRQWLSPGPRGPD